jgi:hypothetical protein
MAILSIQFDVDPFWRYCRTLSQLTSQSLDHITTPTVHRKFSWEILLLLVLSEQRSICTPFPDKRRQPQRSPNLRGGTSQLFRRSYLPHFVIQIYLQENSPTTQRFARAPCGPDRDCHCLCGNPSQRLGSVLVAKTLLQSDLRQSDKASQCRRSRRGCRHQRRRIQPCLTSVLQTRKIIGVSVSTQMIVSHSSLIIQLQEPSVRRDLYSSDHSSR